MKRINFFIEDELFIQLKSLPGTMTEHIKVSIREYLKNLYTVTNSVSKSSIREDGEENG